MISTLHLPQGQGGHQGGLEWLHNQNGVGKTRVTLRLLPRLAEAKP